MTVSCTVVTARSAEELCTDNVITSPVGITVETIFDEKEEDPRVKDTGPCTDGVIPGEEADGREPAVTIEGELVLTAWFEVAVGESSELLAAAP